LSEGWANKAQRRQKVAAQVFTALCGMALCEKKPFRCLDFWFFVSRQRTEQARHGESLQFYILGLKYSIMLDLNDSRWEEFYGGYKIPYNAAYALKDLEQASDITELDEIIVELYDELHHQGDVDLASYYAVPHLIRIAWEKPDFFDKIMGLVITIETARLKNNPPIPADLKADYEQAMLKLGELGKLLLKKDWDLAMASVALSAIAISKGHTDLGKAIINLEDPGTLEEFIENF
jgi:hypothetical protein